MFKAFSTNRRCRVAPILSVLLMPLWIASAAFPALSQPSVAAAPVANPNLVMELPIGHLGEVKSLAWSPDGKTLASGGSDCQVKLWQADGKLLRTLIGHTGGSVLNSGISALAWSPDGTLIASATAESEPWQDGGQLKVWDAATGALKFDFRGDKAAVLSLAFHPEGRLLASSGSEGLRVWDVAIGREVWQSKGYQGNANAVAWSPDGSLLVSGGDDKTARFWDSATFAARGALPAFINKILALSWSQDGKTLAIGSGHEVHLWDKASQRVRRMMTGGSWTQNLAWMPDGATIIAGHGEDTVAWNAETGAKIQGMSGIGFAIALSPNGETLAGGWGNNVTLWSTATAAITSVLRGSVRLNSVAWSPDGASLVTPARDKTLKIWDAATGALTRIVPTEKASFSVAFSRDGERVVTGDVEGNLTLWNARTWTPEHVFEGVHDAVVSSVAFSPDGALIASGSADRKVKLWDAKSHTLKQTLPDFAGIVHVVAFSPDGSLLATGSGNATLPSQTQMWDVASGRSLWKHEGDNARQITSIAWSPDGTAVAGAAYEIQEGVKIWDAASGQLKTKLIGYSRPINALAWLPNGANIIAGGVNGLRMWAADTGQPMWTSPTAEYIGLPDGLAVAPDGKRFASVGTDGLLRIWSLAAFGQARQVAALLSLPSKPETPAFLATTSKGYFWTSPGAEKLVRFHQAGHELSPEAIATRLNHPELVKDSLAGKTLPEP